MNAKVCNRVAIVTGASRGIGRAIALRLACDGAAVALAARDRAALDRAVYEIQAAGGQAASIALDLRLPESAGRLVAFTVESFGRIDILVNNAGATKRGEFLTLTDDDWIDGFTLKFFGAMRLTRAAWPHLKAQSGSVVHISGIGGRTPGREFAIGGSVNAALLSFTKALAESGTGGWSAGQRHQSWRGEDRQAAKPPGAHRRRNFGGFGYGGTYVGGGVRYYAGRRAGGYRGAGRVTSSVRRGDLFTDR